MLSVQDNQRLTRVEKGTPGGEMFRRYWQPALLSSELPENDGAPVRVRLLGEDLIAFRDTQGKVGLVDAYCPHRRAPLFFGRNEECGLRCVYHGWKFDTQGNCVDMPSEPVGTPLQVKVKLQSYPTSERGGLIWTYMGPLDQMPGEPDYEWLRVPEGQCHVSKTFEHCNYLQALEGGLDTVHSSFLHYNKLGDKTLLRQRDRTPKLEMEQTDYGYWYTSHRNAGDDGAYVRVYHFMMPNQQMRALTTGLNGGKAAVPRINGHIWVPVDSENTLVYNWTHAHNPQVNLTREHFEREERNAGRGPDDLIPGTFALKANRANDFMIDRQKQKTETFTGIPGINTQDIALQESMETICDRSREFLGTSDRAIIMMRRIMLEAVASVERGESPRGAQPESYRAVRACDAILAPGMDWRQAFATELVAKW